MTIITEVLAKINLYFFDSEQISLSDFLFFYGTLAFMAVMASIFTYQLLTF
ncbi:MAG TPA: hypothetical protein VK085_07570 [Pseudogracilibacillus sp.]|nr:hypothetical protein [Pseudogracilibacillus sp.]